MRKEIKMQREFQKLLDELHKEIEENMLWNYSGSQVDGNLEWLAEQVKKLQVLRRKM